jgi:hypothetical protein
MGKKLFFMMMVVIVSGLTWFAVDISLAEMNTSTEAVSNSEALCAGEAASQSSICQELEERILAVTLRIEIRTWIIYVEGEGYTTLASSGHGTVMGGRYLLTHNHFQLPLLELFADHNGEFATVTLYTAAGDLLWEGPLTTAAVAFDDTETLLLEFLARDGSGIFETLDVPSADFGAKGVAPLVTGTTVAQVSWDEEQAFVQWAQVKALADEKGTSVIDLNECLIPGSSGGGVFLNGTHIANNWSRSAGCVEGADDAVLLYSTAALNSAELLAAAN